jgi:hypothetical protein
MSYSFGKSIVTDGLTFCVDAANVLSCPSGADLTDIVGGNVLSAVNGPTFNSGKGGYFIYDGVNDKHEETTGNLSGTNGSFEAWFYMQPTASFRQSIFSALTAGWSDRRFLINLENDEQLRFAVWTNNSADTVAGNSLYSTTTLTINQWYHVVCTYDSSAGQKIYIDGSLDCSSSTVLTGTLGTASTIDIGCRGISTSPDFLINGGVATCRAYNRALTADEIAQNYNALKNRFV